VTSQGPVFSKVDALPTAGWLAINHDSGDSTCRLKLYTTSSAVISRPAITRPASLLTFCQRTPWRICSTQMPGSGIFQLAARAGP